MSEQTDKTQISLRVPTSTVDAFEQIARALDRDRTWVMLRALSHFLAEEGADILREADGLAALDRGDGVDFDGVMDEATRIVDQAKLRRRGIAG
ncbi:CopG family ribbon-helix-helix protein [Rhodopseudomonas palustris]|uniref:CopG family ribbon-helix-helix protein n=1 Tax=Rhodopseudomonas palustris TaxID=1076 RepID=UPI00059F039E